KQHQDGSGYRRPTTQPYKQWRRVGCPGIIHQPLQLKPQPLFNLLFLPRQPFPLLLLRLVDKPQIKDVTFLFCGSSIKVPLYQIIEFFTFHVAILLGYIGEYAGAAKSSSRKPKKNTTG